MRRLGMLAVLLLGVDFLDELASGVPFLGAPGIQAEFQVSYGMAAGWLLAAVQLLSVVIEPPMFLLADRYPRRWFASFGLLALGLTCIVASLAPSYWVLLAAVALYGPLGGCGVGMSQAALMDAHPDDRERMMTRWTFMGWLGDLGTPLLFSLLALLGGGWRAAFFVVGACLAFYAPLVWRQRFPETHLPDPEDGRPAEPAWSVLRGALRERRLLVWCSAVFLCGLLDEILLAFGALHLRDGLGAGVHERDAVVLAWVVGGLVGLLLTDRLLVSVEPLRLLVALSACGTVAYVLWLSATSVVASGVALFGVGLTTSGLYPIAKARAYRVLPDRAGAVNAVNSLFIPLDVALPLALGFVADTAGLTATLALLAAQPIGLLVIGLWARQRRGEATLAAPQ